MCMNTSTSAPKCKIHDTSMKPRHLIVGITSWRCPTCDKMEAEIESRLW